MDRELQRLMNDLAPPARAVMLLRYQEDRDLAEIGAMLDMPVNTVKSHIKRSLTALRARMIGAKLVECEQ
jgi:RNA polymerase sigma-70 factor (ECF subfamily)